MLATLCLVVTALWTGAKAQQVLAGDKVESWSIKFNVMANAPSGIQCPSFVNQPLTNHMANTGCGVFAFGCRGGRAEVRGISALGWIVPLQNPIQPQHALPI